MVLEKKPKTLFMLLLNLLIGPLFSAFILWVIGKKREYDFKFRNVLIISFSSAAAGIIPFVGIYVSFGIFVCLFFILERMPYLETMWVCITAFAIKWGLTLLIMMSLNTLNNKVPGASDITNPLTREPNQKDTKEYAKTVEFLKEAYSNLPPTNNLVSTNSPPLETNKVEIAETTAVTNSVIKFDEIQTIHSVAKIEAPPAPAPAPEHMIKKYRISGFASSGNQRMVIINNHPLHAGDKLDDSAILHEIASSSVVISVNKHLYIITQNPLKNYLTPYE